jgi:hypothetical protein
VHEASVDSRSVGPNFGPEGFTCHKDLLEIQWRKSRGHYEKRNGLPKFLAGHYVPLSNPFPGIIGIHGELLKTDIGKSCAKIYDKNLFLNPCCNWVNSQHIWYLKKLCLLHVHPFHYMYRINKHIASYMA